MIGDKDSPVTLRAISDHVLVSDMEFGEVTTAAGIVLKSDDGQSRGIKPRWGKVFAVGPEQKDVKVGQWVLMEHGRWTRKIEIYTDEGVKAIHRADVEGMMLVSDTPPSKEDLLIGKE